MKKLVLFAIGGLLCMVSCKKEKDITVIPKIAESSEAVHFCIPREPFNTESLETGARNDGVIEKSKKWKPGQTIKIKFVNGTGFWQRKVKLYAAEWLKYTNLKFEYVDDRTQYADIKIGFKFKGDLGSWSYIGTDCKLYAQNEPTMNFGWLDPEEPESEIKAVILHEFGHALGLHHEHLSPAVNISWDRPKIYKILAGSPNFWSKEDVDHNYFNKLSRSMTNYTQFDSKSIMCYDIPKEFTTNGYSVPPNYQLSSIDKKFISKSYPKK